MLVDQAFKALMKADSADYGDAAQQLPRKRSGKAAEAANGDTDPHGNSGHGRPAAAEGDQAALDDADDVELPGPAHATPAWAAPGTRIAQMQGGANGAGTGSGGDMRRELRRCGRSSPIKQDPSGLHVPDGPLLPPLVVCTRADRDKD